MYEKAKENADIASRQSKVTPTVYFVYTEK